MRGIAVLLGAAAAWYTVTGAVPKQLNRVGSALSPKITARVAGASLAVGTVTAVVVHGAFGIPAVAVALGLMASAVPIKRTASAVAAENQRVMRAWPDILLRIRSSLSAGSTIADATIEALQSAGEPFASLAGAVRREVIIGRGFAHAMEGARRALEDEVSDRVFVTLTTAAETGGQRVGEIVTALARSIGDEVRLRAAHDASMGEQRLTANVALGAPWVLLILSIATNPQAREAFGSGQGVVVVAVGFLATATGWLLAMRTAHLARPPRLFR